MGAELLLCFGPQRLDLLLHLGRYLRRHLGVWLEQQRLLERRLRLLCLAEVAANHAFVHAEQRIVVGAARALFRLCELVERALVLEGFVQPHRRREVTVELVLLALGDGREKADAERDRYSEPPHGP